MSLHQPVRNPQQPSQSSDLVCGCVSTRRSRKGYQEGKTEPRLSGRQQEETTISRLCSQEDKTRTQPSPVYPHKKPEPSDPRRQREETQKATTSTQNDRKKQERTLKQLPQRLDEFQFHIRQQSSDVMVRLDRRGRPAEGDGFDDVRVECALEEPFDGAFGTCVRVSASFNTTGRSARFKTTVRKFPYKSASSMTTTGAPRQQRATQHRSTQHRAPREENNTQHRASNPTWK